MGATLIESADEHHWVLLDHQVTQVVVDAGSFRVQTWSLDGSAEIRCSAPFALRQASGTERTLNPTETETLAPLLGLLRRRLESITVTRDGELTATFSGGTSIVVAGARGTRTPGRSAWEVQGGGALEGMSYSGALPQPHGH
jgi:hypothetical protein